MKYTFYGVLAVAFVIGLIFYMRGPKISQTSPAHPASPIASSTPATSPSVSKGQTPSAPFKLAAGFTIHTFAQGLGTARDLQFSPGGTLLVSDPSSGQVYALPDKNNDGVSDGKNVILSGVNHAHGLAFYNNKLYVAGVDQVVRYNWDENNLSATKDKVLFSLPENNDHNARTITFDTNGTMYVSVGSTCNVCNESSNLSATVLTADADGNNLKVFAKGLRNAPFIQFNPKTNELWGTEMGRDNLGDNIPPDEINIIKDGQDYGWPNCYGDKIHDADFDSADKVDCNNTISPIFQIPAHSAPLGWSFIPTAKEEQGSLINSSQFPSDWQGDMLVAYHGSWNRSTPIGYKVVHLKVSGNTITNSEDFMTGFLPSGASNGPNDALARPVDLTFDKNGNLYLSDDKSGSIYIIQKQSP